MIALGHRVAVGLSRLTRVVPETLFVLALLCGWGLAGWGLGLVLGRWVSPVGVWAMCAGGLLLSCCGWKMLGTLAKHGLYSLSQADRK